MKISLPDEAKSYINQEAAKLLLLLRPAPKEPDKPKSRLSSTHQFIDHHLIDKDFLGSAILSMTDGFGKKKSKFFGTDTGFIGLTDTDYDAYEHLVERIAGRPEIRAHLSQEYIDNIFFKWFEAKYKGTLPQSVSFTQYLIEQAETDVKEIKVAIPVSYLEIEESFSVGRIVFDFYTTEFFDRFEAAVLAKHPSYQKDDLIHTRKEYQGVVFASLVVLAEKRRAVEIAVEETEKAIMLLRFFSPTVFFPDLPSYFDRMGHASLPISHSFVFEESEWPEIVTGLDEKAEFKYSIDRKQLQLLRASGLESGSQLIIESNPTEFEELLLNSILLFTKAIVSKDYHDKLVFCLASIETLLLKNSTEPIQHSVGLRLAFLSSGRKQDRKAIIDLIRKAYEIRSSYIHHGGRKRQDIELLRSVQVTIWSVLRGCIQNRAKFKNQTQLLDYVETLILT